jgi:preprotein translocase subunit SecE
MAINTKRSAREDSGGGIGRFFLETWSELRKVVWPTSNELFRYTMVVIMFVILIAVFVGVVDLGLREAVKRFIYNGVSGVTH